MIAFVIGRILLTEAALLVIPLAVALLCGESPAPFLLPIALLVLLGGLMSFRRPRSTSLFARDGLAVVAEQQTGGRGRRGRSFVSPAGQGLYLSVLLRPRSPVRRCCVRRIPPRKQRNTPHSPPWAPAGVRAPQSRRWRSAKPGESAAPVPRRRTR